jgi:uncharacterized cupin superfamily protein
MIPSVTDQALQPAPINPSWVCSGNPTARNAVLSRSADGTASTLVWDCTAGEFDWIYDIDETIYFIEGSATISDGRTPPRQFVAGDVLFLPKGAVAHWHVENYVRKVAFCRRTQPAAVNFCLRAVRKAKRVTIRLARSAAGALVRTRQQQQESNGPAFAEQFGL